MKRAVFTRQWMALTEAQRIVYRHKAQWEHMSLMAVMREWPTTDAEAREILGLPVRASHCGAGEGK